jgi:hypothetical protein
MQISRNQLAQVPYLDASQIGPDRVVQLMPLYDGDRWHMWHPGPNDSMIKLAIVDYGMGDYVAKAEARDTDLHFRFIEVVWQHVSYPAVTRPTFAISEDMRNLATALAKVDFFWDHRDALGYGVAEFVRTEIEYMLVVARSLLDHLHEVVVGIWSNVRLLDEAQDRTKKSRGLPRRLSKVCLDEHQKPQSAAVLTQRFALPPPIAEFYAEAGTHLADLRAMRDAVVHHGSSAGTIFMTDRGFGIARDSRLANLVGEWTELQRFNENVLSLRPALAHLAVGSLYVCEAATNSITSCIQVRPPIAPGYRVFTRAPHAPALLRAQEVLRGADPWWAPESS